MELRTAIKIQPSGIKIAYTDPVIFIGSCFASEIGKQMQAGLMQVMINPSGVVYNPVSVINSLDMILNNREFNNEDLYNHNGTYLSFYHSTDFSSADPLLILEKINKRNNAANRFLSGARFLFISFGTARVYKLTESGEVVSNCHKMPSRFFTRELLTVNDIIISWLKTMDKLHSFNPDLKIIFTVSPVRHLKDGAHGNNVSKSILFLAVEELLKHPSAAGYFPSYELLMDDLRDYRFYADDMVHPSERAIEYIWESFTGCYFGNETSELWRELNKIVKSTRHKIMSDSSVDVRLFAESMLSQISAIQKRAPLIDFTGLTRYFNALAAKNK